MGTLQHVSFTQYVEYQPLLASMPFLKLNKLKNPLLSIFDENMIHHTKFNLINYDFGSQGLNGK